MTKVNIISGFLGAGKTTLIKKLLGGAFEGEKVVLLENEYGEVGIDGGFMKDSGIQVTELNSGCICCTLVGDFADALSELIDTYHPDRIIIEPSGVGKLSDIRKVVDDCAKEHELVLAGCATVADVSKCRLYIKNFGEFFNDQIESAETIILSRTQTASQDRIEKAIALLREHNERARIITTPWDELEPAKILETIETPDFLLTVEELFKDAHEHHHHDHDEHCTCGCHDHDHEHHHHDHDEECCCGHDHEHHHHDHDEECCCGHDHEHHHHNHDEECCCGHHDHEHHHHDHDEECCCGHHDHEHHHHDHDEECCCGHHDHEHHHHDHDEECCCGHHDHEHHHHDHDEECCCGHHDHEHHHHDHDEECCCGHHDHEHHHHDHDEECRCGHHDHEHHHHDEECCCGHDHEHHHHDHDEECCCGHDHEHHHHDHDEECCCGHHDHEHHHEHEHHHDHDEHCSCGCHDHDHEHHHEHHHHEHGDGCSCGHHHGHHADEVFQNIGVETPKKFEEAAIREALEALEDEHRFGSILRAKGILPTTDGKWLHFDYVPGESELRYGSADYTGRLCVIGVNINEEALKELFGV